MKRKLPISAIRFVEELHKMSNNIVSKALDKSYIVKFVDRNIDLDFYFKIISCGLKNDGHLYYKVEYFPANENECISILKDIPESWVKAYFEKWLKLIEEYNTPSSVFDDMDTISMQYYHELEPRFSLMDSDKDVSAYSLEKQKVIILAINTAINIIEGEKGIDEGDRIELIKLAEKTKKELSSSTKSKAVYLIKKFLAKCYKVGIELGEKIFIEVSTKYILSTTS